MLHLFSKWQKFKGKLKDNLLCIFLDYDGTLTPIVDTPKDALLSHKVKALLGNLSRYPGCRITIISGRGLVDLKRRVGLKEIIYVGNHGLEMAGPKIKFESQISPSFNNVIRNRQEELKTKLAGIKGVIIEDKGLTISVHYRLVAKELIPRVKQIFNEATIYHLAGKKIKVKSGKMVLEINPPIEWDKGKAVLWLIARERFIAKNKKIFPIYIGDDTTDEDAFKVIKRRGLAVFVGKPRESSAKYYLKNTHEVIGFLEDILDMAKGKLLWRN